jgi:hypothetical protein
MICHWCARGRLSTKELALNSTRLRQPVPYGQTSHSLPDFQYPRWSSCREEDKSHSHSSPLPQSQPVNCLAASSASVSASSAVCFSRASASSASRSSASVSVQVIWRSIQFSSLVCLISSASSSRLVRSSSSGRSVRALLPTG